MEADTHFPSCSLRLIASDFSSPMMRNVVEHLWESLETKHPIHRHFNLPKWNEVDRNEVWIIDANPPEWRQEINHFNKVWPCAALFLHERDSQKALPDLRFFAVADWIFSPWGPGELTSRIQALAMRVHRLPEPTDNAFFKAGSESSHVPMQKAKSDAVSSFERGYLQTLMQIHAGNVSAAARSARKHRRAFLALLQKHSIKPDEFRESHHHADLVVRR